jgi:predicted enzyme related to lactoylglutathione lyase
MNSKTNSLNWFEVPATDIKRAKKFYETVFDITMEEMDMGGMKSALFPMEGGSGKANGCLTQSDMHKPSMTGCVIYLNADPDLSDALGRVEKAGGKVTMPKTGIGPNGFMAFFVDSEGNHMAMHSNK